MPNPSIESGADLQPIRVLVVGEHQLRRMGLQLLLEQQAGIQLVGAVGTDEMEASIAQTQPQVLLVKVDTPGVLALCRGLAGKDSGPRLLAISSRYEAHAITATLAAGFVGYVHCEASVAQLVDAIVSVHAGQMYLSPGAVQAALGPLGTDKQHHARPLLTRREREVLALLAEGHPTKQIAGMLRLSGKTIETHRLRIMRKLKLYSVAELTKYAIRQGLSNL